MEPAVTVSEKDDLSRVIAGFLRDIGLNVSFGSVPDDTFLPGILVKDGGLVIDAAKLRYPGDLLHEAGHLAFAPAAIRPTISGEVVLPGVNAAVVEVQAIAWSYAAAVFLGIDPAVVFHQDGYHGKSEAILFNLSIGNILGLAGLSEHGMAYSPSRAAELDLAPFPVMHKWLAD